MNTNTHDHIARAIEACSFEDWFLFVIAVGKKMRKYLLEDAPIIGFND